MDVPPETLLGIDGPAQMQRTRNFEVKPFKSKFYLKINMSEKSKMSQLLHFRTCSLTTRSGLNFNLLHMKIFVHCDILMCGHAV